jgi:hypothetical protein
VAPWPRHSPLAHPEGPVRGLRRRGRPHRRPARQLVAAQRNRQSATGNIPLAYLARLARAFERDTAATGPRGRARWSWLAWSSR